MPTGVPNKRYTPEFKKLVVKTMLNEKLSYSETGRRFDLKWTATAGLWNTSNRNSLSIWTTTIIAESRQNWRACRLRFTDNKPFRQLEPFLLWNIVWLQIFRREYKSVLTVSFARANDRFLPWNYRSILLGRGNWLYKIAEYEIISAVFERFCSIMDQNDNQIAVLFCPLTRAVLPPLWEGVFTAWFAALEIQNEMPKTYVLVPKLKTYATGCKTRCQKL